MAHQTWWATVHEQKINCNLENPLGILFLVSFSILATYFFKYTFQQILYLFSISFKYYFFILFFYYYFNISLFFLYSFLTNIFFKFPTTIFFKFHNIFKFCSKKRTRRENIYISFLILLVDFNNLTVLEFEKTTRRIQEKI